MGISKHFNFKAASKVLKDAKKDVQRPKDEVGAKRDQRKSGGKK